MRLLEIKSRHNLTDDAFCQIIIAINCNDTSFYQTKHILKSIVPIVSIWVDMCSNSCCAYTGSYKYYDECEYCHIPRFQIDELNQKGHPQRQMAYFSIKDRLIIQYRDLTRSEELRYRANYT